MPGVEGRQGQGNWVDGLVAAGSATAAEFEANRIAAYEAVSAHLANDVPLVAKHVMDLVREPIASGDALLALIMACGAMVDLWAGAIEESPEKAWAKFAHTVAWKVSSRNAGQSLLVESGP